MTSLKGISPALWLATSFGGSCLRKAEKGCGAGDREGSARALRSFVECLVRVMMVVLWQLPFLSRLLRCVGGIFVTSVLGYDDLLSMRRDCRVISQSGSSMTG